VSELESERERESESERKRERVSESERARERESESESERARETVRKRAGRALPGRRVGGKGRGGKELRMIMADLSPFPLPWCLCPQAQHVRASAHTRQKALLH